MLNQLSHPGAPTILTTFKCAARDIGLIHVLVQPSPPSISRSFSCSQTAALSPVTLTLTPSPSPGAHHPLSASVDGTLMGTPCGWGRAGRVLLCLAPVTVQCPPGPSTWWQVGGRSSFLRLDPTSACGWTHRVHSSISGRSGCFYLLAIVNHAAVNVGVRVPLCAPTCISCG